jgi:hypothetical protein
LQGCGAENRNKQRRKQKTREREKQLDGCLLRCLFSTLPALGA